MGYSRNQTKGDVQQASSVWFQRKLWSLLVLVFQICSALYLLVTGMMAKEINPL